jgi:hypothetical protein
MQEQFEKGKYEENERKIKEAEQKIFLEQQILAKEKRSE